MISTVSTTAPKHQTLLVVSPLAVIGIGQFAIRFLEPIWGVWSWVPFWFFYLLFLSLFIYLSVGKKQVMNWLASAHGHWIWPALSCIIPVAMTLPIFIPNWRFLLAPQVSIWTLVFVVVNPLIEEFYWRGALLDATEQWPGWLSVSYSVLCFALSHLWIGVIAAAGHHPSAMAGPILMGVIWALAYRATGSLRWPILGHFLANLFSLSVPVFLNLYIPPGG